MKLRARNIARLAFLWLATVVAIVCPMRVAAGSPLEEAKALRDRGEFDKATQMLSSYLEESSLSQ